MGQASRRKRDRRGQLRQELARVDRLISKYADGYELTNPEEAMYIVGADAAPDQLARRQLAHLLLRFLQTSQEPDIVTMRSLITDDRLANVDNLIAYLEWAHRENLLDAAAYVQAGGVEGVTSHIVHEGRRS